MRIGGKCQANPDAWKSRLVARKAASITWDLAKIARDRACRRLLLFGQERIVRDWRGMDRQANDSTASASARGQPAAPRWLAPSQQGTQSATSRPHAPRHAASAGSSRLQSDARQYQGKC